MAEGDQSGLQCVILLGGLGSRLGEVARTTPKPLLPVGGVPFVELLIGEARRRGFDRFLLLAGHRSEAVVAFLAQRQIEQRFDCRAELLVEPHPLGTGGALVNARPCLAEDFLLLNGDTWFDFNWLDLFAEGRRSGGAMRLALREVAAPDRYETVDVGEGDRVIAIRPRQTGLKSAAINGGVYYLTRQALEGLACPASLEADLLPALAAQDRLSAKLYPGYFIDIGLPETLAAAEQAPSRLKRPAAVLATKSLVSAIHDHAALERWTAAVKRLNAAGYYVFGVAPDTAAVRAIGAAMTLAGAYVDAWLNCAEATSTLFGAWSVERDSSILIGDTPSDLEAASAASFRGHLFDHGDPVAFMEAVLDFGA
jgi:NDP-sugar pyrophosphorylase family protein